MLTGKHILLGVTGSIAAYKAPDLVSRLKKLGAQVKVIMTKSATEFVSPLTFQTMSQNPVAVEMFEKVVNWEVEHISLAKWADILLIAPATANYIGKLAHGIADDMLSTVSMATKAPVLIAPAMNTGMYESQALQENIKILEKRGVTFIEPDSGRLACGDTGKGKLAPLEDIVDGVLNMIAKPHDLSGKRILVTAGGTKEAIDPVRFITNHSTGKMGVEIARAAKHRGGEVYLVAGNISAPVPYGIEVIPVSSATQMHEACMDIFPSADIVIKAAAVADYRPENVSAHKIKKGSGLALSLTQNPDILAEMGEKKRDDQVLVGFCMETENLLSNASAKLNNKNLDIIAANHLLSENAGFGADCNTVTLLFKNGESVSLPNMSKYAVANEILNYVCKL